MRAEKYLGNMIPKLLLIWTKRRMLSHKRNANSSTSLLFGFIVLYPSSSNHTSRVTSSTTAKYRKWDMVCAVALIRYWIFCSHSFNSTKTTKISLLLSSRISTLDSTRSIGLEQSIARKLSSKIIALSTSILLIRSDKLILMRNC